MALFQGCAGKTSGREDVVETGSGGDGNGKTRDRSFPTTISRPLSLISVPAVQHPVEKRLVPVHTFSRPTVRPLLNCFSSHRLPSCSHPIPTFAHDFSHPASHSHNNIRAVTSYFNSIYHRFSRFLNIFVLYDHGCNYTILVL